MGWIFLGREIGQHRDYSEETAQKIDTAIDKLIGHSYNRARNVLNENRDILHQLAALLLEKETVTGPELNDFIRSLRPETNRAAKRAEKKRAPQSTAAQLPDHR